MAGNLKQQGFTLIELIVVLVIVVLGFSAVGYSIHQETTRQKLKPLQETLFLHCVMPEDRL